jgi:hypothetical protein
MSKSRSAVEIRGALLGTLLGDSTVTTRGEFSCEQITESLIDYKRNILNQISGVSTYKHSRDRGNTQVFDNKVYGRKVSYVVQTNQHAYFSKLRNRLYFTEGKQVSYSVLEDLTDEGIALWFMDDGYLDFKKSNSTRNLRICTDSFDEISIKNIQRYFLEYYDIETKVYMHNAGHGRKPGPRISFNAENSQKLICMMYKYFIPDMLYKINLKYTEFTLNSKRCSEDYKQAAKYIIQHTPSNDDDIV